MEQNIRVKEDKCFKDATFSIHIDDVPFVNREALNDLPDMVLEQYKRFFKLKYGEEMPDELLETICNTYQDNG